MKVNNPTREKQERIFKELYDKYKGTLMAVSSESPAHKELRFEQIAAIFDKDNEFSVHDVGMGLADLNDYIKKKYPGKIIQYSGSDILIDFVNASQQRFPELHFYHRDLAEQAFEDSYDYLVMSGLFHQRNDSSIPEWEAFTQNILRNCFLMAKKGIAFNFISPFVDFYQTHVYYCNLIKILNFINDDLSRFFEIRHNYALFEFTVFVFKEEYIKMNYPQPEFRKYFKV